MRRRPNFAMVCVTAITVLLVVGLIPANAMAQARELTNCLWVGPVAGGQYNAGYPDEAGVYWYAEYQLPAGAKLVLRGQFPHARYMSLNSYDPAARPTDAINDVGTVPNPGSSNPFQEGARRRVTDRSFTVEVVNEPPPAGPRRSNTLYAGVSGQATQRLLYRIFVADKGRDVTGDTGLPQHEMRLADATALTGQVACDAIKANPARDIPHLRLKLPVDRYRAMRDPVPNLPDTHPAFNPPDWEGYFGAPYSSSRFLKGTPREGERARVATTKAGGFYSSRDVDYISAFVDRKFGSVLMLRGKARDASAASAGEPLAGTAVAPASFRKRFELGSRIRSGPKRENTYPRGLCRLLRLADGGRPSVQFHTKPRLAVDLDSTRQHGL